MNVPDLLADTYLGILGPAQDAVADNMKQLRQQYGWTQKQLADKCGLAQSQIGRLEMGTNAELYAPTLSLLAKVAHGFDVQIVRLLVTPELTAEHRTVLTEADKIEVVKTLVENIGNGSYRWLIYDKLGLTANAYGVLYDAGLLGLNNFLAETRDSEDDND